MCWAATASNMLWSTNYAPNSINPVTGKVFTGEDDVFDYFRKCFTDDYGSPDSAIKYFLEGEYPDQGSEDAAQLKEDAPAGGLMKGALDGDILKIYGAGDTADPLADLNNVSGKTGSALIKWFDTDSGTYSGAHWLTIYDLVAGNKGFNAIRLIDSDNDMAYDTYPDALGDTQAMAVAAASMPNKILEYDLVPHYDSLHTYWQVQGLYESECTQAIITWVCYLLDMVEAGGDWPPAADDDSSEETPSTDSQESEAQQAEIYAKLMEEVFTELKEMMIEQNLSVFSPTGNVYDRSSDKGYSLIVRRNATSLMNVFIDGQLLEPEKGYYTVTMNPQGMFTITISREYVKQLEVGQHSFRMEFANGDVIDAIIIVN